MKGATWPALLVFVAATIAGYLLTARSFAWIDAPPSGTSAPPAQAIDLNALKDKIPPAWAEQAKKLTTTQLACLQASIRAERIPFVLQGSLTSQEAAAVAACLKK